MIPMKPNWPLHGNFLRYHLEARKNETIGKNLAVELKIDQSTLTRLCTGQVDVTEHEDKYRDHVVPTGLPIVAETQYWVNFKDSYIYLRALENQVGTDLAQNMPALAKIYLTDQKLITPEGAATAALIDWKAANSRSAKKVHPPASQESSSKLGVHSTPQLPRKVLKGDNPENFVGEFCKMGAIQVEHFEGSDAINVVYKLAFGSSSKNFGDLVAKCGLKEAKISSDFIGLEEIKYHHAGDPLKGRLARVTDTHEFVVKQTCAGVPDPFLMDSVFDGTSICSARLDKDVRAAGIRLTCSVEFSDLRVDAYAADGERFPKMSEEQKELRKRALEVFILDRCRTGGFRGIIATAGWENHG